MNKVFDPLIFYKCRWCGNVFTRGWTPVRSTLNALLISAIKRSLDTKCPPMITIHDCDEGRRGVADLIGAREKKEDERPTPV